MNTHSIHPGGGGGGGGGGPLPMHGQLHVHHFVYEHHLSAFQLIAHMHMCSKVKFI